MNEAREKGEGADKEVLGEVEVEKKGVKRDLFVGSCFDVFLVRTIIIIYHFPTFE